MRTTRSPRGRLLLLILFVGAQLFLSACNGESRTSGTMVQVSEQAKKHVESRRDVYKNKSQPRKEKTIVTKKRSF
jgi:hypothetical protein